MLPVGHYRGFMGDYNEAKSLLQESLAIGEETGDWFITGGIDFCSGLCRSITGGLCGSKKVVS